MKLLSFKVEHFRCLFSTDWIPLSELSIFTGENDGGKSTTLYALQTFLDSKGAPLADDYAYTEAASVVSDSFSRKDEITLQAKFGLRDSEASLLKSVWDIDSREIVIRRIFKPNSPPPAFEIEAETYPDEAFATPLDDYTVVQLKDIAKKFSISVVGSTRKQDYVDTIRNWLRSQTKSTNFVKLPDGLVNALPQMQIFSSETALDPEKEIRKTLSTQFQSLIDSEKYSGTISQIKKDVESDLNIQLEKLAPFVKSYSNEVETITIRPSFNFASGLTSTPLQLSRADGRPILLQQSGAGQRRRFSLAVYEWSQEIFKNRDENSRQLIMAFDEPDTHLDYKSQRHIFDVIRRFADLPAIQVIVCTHSLNFIERVPINQIVYYSLSDTSRHTKTEVLAVSDHEMTDIFLYEISKNMGLKNSVMLHERCFLLVEGATEMSALPVLFHKQYGIALQAAGICLLNGENNYGARILAKFLHSNKRQVLFLVDTDCTTSDIRKYFTPSSFIDDGIDVATQVHFVGTKELEDAFVDDAWARMANAHYPKTTGSPWESTDFQMVRSKPKFSKAVQQLIKSEVGLPSEPSKADLGYKLAQCLPATEIPAAILKCLQEAYQRANL